MFTLKLSRFIFNTNFADLPQGVVSAAKMAVLDYIGVAMAGSQEPSGRMVRELVEGNQSSPETTVIGGRFKASCSLAALANGNSGHVLDYDDCLDFPEVGLGHPSTGILPAALAIGEKYHLSGQDVIAAYCLGIEAYAKIGLLAKEAFRHAKGWEWTGILGVMGAVAAVSKLLKLNESQIVTGFGIAASLSSGLTRNFGSMAGHLHAGNAARNAVDSGFLAARGYTAYTGIIEGPSGFYNTLTGDTSPVSQEAMQENLNSLGNPWNIIKPGLMFKAFPLAHISHFGVDAALQLKEKHVIDWQKIEEIEFRVPSILKGAVSYREPQTGVEGKFSFGYCTSRVLIYGGIKISDFSDDAVKDPDTRALMRKINWVVVPQTPQDGVFGWQEVILKMKDGNIYSCRVDHPRGEPQNPLTLEQHTAKYRHCAEYAGFNEATISQIKDRIFDLENIKDISQLMELLGKRGK